MSAAPSRSPAHVTARAPLVLELDRVDRRDLSSAGGKGANLGEMLRAGFPVPPGFVITTAAYEQIVASNALDAPIDQARATGDGAAARSAFERAMIPPDIAQAIRAAYWRLGSTPVAVRSSATAEDLPDAAFAGQQDTVLGVVDEAGLLDAVRRCWGSLWSDRAIAYRQRQGFAEAPVALAVVVQRLVPADAAGVLFTANPITGARNETIIDTSPGLGEAIVSGLVTPDHLVLRRRRFGWQIVDRRAGEYEIEMRPRTGGGIAQVQGSASDTPILPDRTARRLARMGAAISRHFGQPRDIEWALAGDKLWVLQSRPITALPDPKSARARLGLPRSGPAEYMQIRPYPIDMTTWMPEIGKALARMVPLGSAAPTFTDMWVEEAGIVTRFAGWPEFRVKPGLLLALPRLVALAIRYDSRDWRADPILAEVLQDVRALEARDARALSWLQLLELIREGMAIPFAVVELRRRYFPRTLLAMGALRLILGRIGRPDLFGQLLSGVDNMTLEANRGLEALASEIRADPALSALVATHEGASLVQALAADAAGRALNRRLDAFLALYGHRELGSPLLVSQPTWRDAPEAVLGMLKGLAQSGRAPSPGPPGWVHGRDEVLAQAPFRWLPLRQLFLAILAEARCFPALREDTHFFMTMPMPVIRRALLEMGRRLVDSGILATPEEVFHLRLEELEPLAVAWPPDRPTADALRETVQQRSARRAQLDSTPLMDVAAIPAPEPSGAALLAGMPGSPGVAEGPVRIITGPAEFGALAPGEILVAPFTLPAWTPLFAHAAAVVVDAGSAMSHAAIVAREYGIPAVMGTGDGTSRVTNGQRVLVDGTRGLVFPASH